ncbi:MAG: hypothetical protein PVF47_15520 [Anaerolineae bacterium]
MRVLNPRGTSTPGDGDAGAHIDGPFSWAAAISYAQADGPAYAQATSQPNGQPHAGAGRVEVLLWRGYETDRR